MKNQLYKLSLSTCFWLKIFGLFVFNIAFLQDINSQNCGRPTAKTDMNVNNVNARLENNGSLFSNARYITPNDPNNQVSAIYATGIWIGGVDKANNTKLSATTYTTTGSDYFSGPLNIDGTTNLETCNQWNRIFTVKGSEIENHIKAYHLAMMNNQPLDCKSIPDNIKYWPSKGNPYFKEKYGWNLPNQELAEYFDIDKNGQYNPCNGDYPYVSFRGCQKNAGDENLTPSEINFWIMNDNGGPQTLSGPTSMQMEIQAYAFAYSTNDPLNDVTFHKYKLINKSNEDLRDCYFGLWVDPDLGCYSDDYFGCDPDNNFAFVYNQDEIDGINGNTCNGTKTYADDIPILSLSFALPPLVGKVFKRDANNQFVLDSLGDKIVLDPPPYTGAKDTLVMGNLSSFTYTGTQNEPTIGSDQSLYNMLKGVDPNGSPYVNGSDTIKHVFPGDPNDPNEWSMCSQNLPFADRRFLLSTGPMLLQPSASNELVIAIATTRGVALPCPDITKVRYTNSVIQEFVQRCVDYEIFGPDAPDLSGIAGDKVIKLILSNETTSDNYNEGYIEKIPYVLPEFDNRYLFEGYKIYQLRTENVRYDQLDDPEFARIISQSDINNDVSKIYNWVLITNPDTSVVDKVIWAPELKVDGSNNGIQKSFDFTQDQFRSGEDKSLINNQLYHFAAVAYAHNEWKSYDTMNEFGQKNPYLEGRSNFKTYTFSPEFKQNIKDFEIQVTRISGQGNPNVFLEVDDKLYGDVLNDNFDQRIKYQLGKGPIEIKVIDSQIIVDHTFQIEMNGMVNETSTVCAYANDAYWTLKDITSGTIILDQKPLSEIKEYVINELGFSITIQNYSPPGNPLIFRNGGVGASVEYQNPQGPKWFNAVKDGGIYGSTPSSPLSSKVLDVARQVTSDPNGELAKLGTAHFIPFSYAKFEDAELPFFLSPATRILINNGILNSTANPLLKSRDLNNVDIVFTNDKSKWSKCVVVESGFDYYTNVLNTKTVGDAKNFELRQSPSVGKDGNSLNDGTIGFSYFPGYAIDVETGNRLNIFFGENSCLGESLTTLLDGGVPLGADMIYNPSSQIGTKADSFDVMGGQHYIYVTRQEYDECAAVGVKFKKGSSLFNRIKGMAGITWTCFPLGDSTAPMLSLEQGLIPNDMIYKLRVNNDYSPSPNFNIESPSQCRNKEDMPVYQFGFEKLSGVVDSPLTSQISIFPNPTLQSNSNIISLKSLPEHYTIAIHSLDGNIVQSLSNKDETNTYQDSDRSKVTQFTLSQSIHAGVYAFSIIDTETGARHAVRWLVF